MFSRTDVSPVVTLAAITMAFLPAIAQSTPSDLATSAAKQLPALTETYKHLHRNPELSHHEEKTSAFLAAELRKAGYTVTERVGKYPDGSQAYGIVAVLENGAGPRLLIRTDMDALPVEEKTGLDYASTAARNQSARPGCGRDACLRSRHPLDCPARRPAKWRRAKANGTER